MKFNNCLRHTSIRALGILFCVLTSTCSASLVFASDLNGSSKAQTSNPDYYEKIRKAALNGSSAAQFELGLLYEYGRGVDQNDLVAVYWYEKSAAQVYSRAQYRLAVLSDNGWGSPLDKEKAFRLYKSAAEKGHELAQHDVAIMYFQGSGTDRSPVQAYKWLKIADLSGNPLMQKHLYTVGQEMSSDEIKLAEYLAKHWIGHSGIFRPEQKL